ncbi:MAG: low temperature requirement protein A [Actinobacteria bacterium]|nr:low temperature requirement protein A [Actinomycetota bacterium]
MQGRQGGKPARIPLVLLAVSALVAWGRWPATRALPGRLRHPTRRAAVHDLRAARLGLNGTYLTLAALVAVAVGNELVIAHPDGNGSPTLSLLLFGGALLYVASQAWYLQLTTGTASRARWATCAALVAGGCAAAGLPRLAGLGLLLIVLGALTWHLIRNPVRA